jgi:hypothetical protein
MPKKWRSGQLGSQDEYKAKKEKAEWAINTMHQIQHHGLHGKNIFRKITVMTQCFDRLNDYLVEIYSICQQQTQELNGYRDKLPVAWADKYQWTEKEDIWLVELRAEGAPIDAIALQMGRTSASISSRLTQLVGVKRPMHIAGIIDGYLNDEKVRGYFVGIKQ